MVCCKNDDQNDIVIVGSLQGIIRIFCPQLNSNTDPLLEYDTGAPILQISTGNYTENSKAVNLAVLQPKKVIVYIIARESKLENYCIFESFQHDFEESTFNMTNTNLGLATNLLAIQTIDGEIKVIKEKNIVSVCSFKPRLLPGPFAFMSVSECFVTVSSNMEVECYRYSNIIMDEEMTATDISTEWNVDIGETARDIKVLISSNEEKVFILGEHTLYVFNNKGVPIFINKLQNEFICFLPYFLSNSNFAILLSSLQPSVYAYCKNEVFWSCQVNFPVIQLEKGVFENNNGILAALGEDGSLECFYFGTDPSAISADKLTRDLSHEEARKEIKYYSDKINKNENPKELKAGLPQISFKFCDDNTLETGKIFKVEGMITTKIALKNVKISISSCKEIKSVKNIQIPFIGGEHQFTLEFTATDKLPSSLNVQVFICFEIDRNKIQLCKEFRIPFSLISEELHSYPNENVQIKLNINKTEILDFNLSENNHIGLKFNDGSSAHISRNLYVFTFICENYNQLWLILEGLVSELEENCFRGNLPWAELNSLIDDHYKIQTSLKAERKKSEDYTNQLYSVEKSFLYKLKNPTNTSLSPFEFVCEKLLDKLNKNAVVISELQTSLQKSNINMAAILKVFIALYHHHKNSREIDLNMLMNIFCVENVDENWEENVHNNVGNALNKELSHGSFLPDNIGMMSTKPLVNSIKKYFDLVE